MLEDPVIVAFERWKRRIIAGGILLGTGLIVIAVLLLEAHTLRGVWDFTNEVMPKSRVNSRLRCGPTVSQQSPSRRR